MTSDERLRQLQQSGWTGDWVVNGQLQHMTNGQFAQPAAPAAPAGPAQTPMGGPAQAPQGGGIGGNQFGPSNLGDWQNWMFSGGVNPGGWQNTGGVDPNSWQGLGGGPNLGFLSNFNTSGQVAPTTADSLQSAMQPYTDAAYQEQTRQLDPQWQQNQAQFNQQMVNQGLAPGSEAYQQAFDNFTRSRDDAYNQARNTAQQQGLAAQAQGFGQGLSQSQLSAQLAQALLGSNTSIANQQLGGNASVMNQLLGGNSSLMNALLGGNSGIAQQMIGGQASRDVARTGANASMHNAGLSHDISQQTIDNGMLEWLLSGGQGVTQYNNGLLNNDQSRNLQFMQYMPGGAGQGQIDVQNPMNNYYNGQMNQWGYNNQQANSQNSMWANLIGSGIGMYMMCSRAVKTTEGPLEAIKALDAVCSLPVDRWSYLGENVVHIGTYAEDFNKALDLPPKPVIDPIDMLGALTASVQALAEQSDRDVATIRKLFEGLDRRLRRLEGRVDG